MAVRCGLDSYVSGGLHKRREIPLLTGVTVLFLRSCCDGRECENGMGSVFIQLLQLVRSLPYLVININVIIRHYTICVVRRNNVEAKLSLHLTKSHAYEGCG